MASKMRPKEGIETILGALFSDELRRLCGKRGIALGRSDLDRRERLAKDYRTSVDELIDDLRRNDLVQVLSGLEFEVEGRRYCLGRLYQARLEELCDAATAVFVEEWGPNDDGDGPVPGSPIDVYLVDGDDDDDDDLDEEADETGDSFADETDAGGPPLLVSSADDEDDLLTDIDGDAGFDSHFPTVEHIDPAASSPDQRHDASLTDFQRDAVAALDRHFAQPGRRGLLCLPTGGGKTRTSLDWLLSRFVARGERILWVTHRVDLLDQAHDEIRGLAWLLRSSRPSGFTVSRYQGRHDDLSGDIVLASAATLARRLPSRQALSSGRPLGVVVYDEAHRAVAKGTWRAISKLLGRNEVAFLGLTATPFRTEVGGTALLEEQLGGAVYQRTFKELVDIGFLARPVFIRQQLRSTEGFKVTSKERAEIARLKDLTPGFLGRLAREPRRNREILEHWLGRRQEYGKTLAFACNVEHADAMAKMFKGKGVRAESLHSDLPAIDRARRLAAFRDGAIEVLINVGILTEGANIPDTKTVLMARPTMSTSLYMQMIGRGARGPKTVPGKTQFYVIDCVDNFAQHGLPLAGQEVAARLEADVLRPRQAAPRVRTPSEARDERRELAMAAAWLAARGFDPRAYTFWGELRWESSGGPASVAVFTETIAPVEEAVRLTEDAITTGHWHLARDRGPYLESLGALRAVDWARVIGDCQRTRIAPQLLAVPELSLTSEDLGVATALHALATEIRTRGFDVAMLSTDRAWAESEPLRARFASPIELRQEVMNLASAQVQAPAVPDATQSAAPSQAAAVDAFAELSLSMARADGVVDHAERLAILRALERLFGGGRAGIVPDVEGVLAGKEALPVLDDTRACGVLRETLDWPSRLVAFDLLFRVALADGRLAEEERLLLQVCAEGLELPREELTDRLQWYRSPEPTAPAPAVAGYKTCPSCSATGEESGNFCGYCGTSMSATR